ncbi:MAG: hypothetical protein DBW78_02065 [Rhodothermaeota bacterium MED-G64]|nr:MAG: hypothetical protein DBW78_02065 [Rhodothermaeota bacterium MED-G64]
MGKTSKEPFVAALKDEQTGLREQFDNRQQKKELLPIEEARANHDQPDWTGYTPPVPAHYGVQDPVTFSVADLRPYIDWTPFFIAWEMKGKYPDIFEDPKVDEVAKNLHKEANEMLDWLEQGQRLHAKGRTGVFAANAEGDDILLYTDASRQNELARFHTLRQQAKKREGERNKAMSDWVAPVGSGLDDALGLFIVSAGYGIDELVAEFEAQHDDYQAILLKAVADRLAEAAAEKMHEIVRTQTWGYAPNESLRNDQLILEEYAGIRPAPGYPAQPDHTEKIKLFELLEGESVMGVHLTQQLAMHPASSVCGLYFSHPEARYFNVGPLLKDQVEEYATRKGMSVKEMETWLASHLGYRAS